MAKHELKVTLTILKTVTVEVEATSREAARDWLNTLTVDGVTAHIIADLDESYEDFIVEPDDCPDCFGDGVEDIDDFGNVIYCTTCGGTGVIGADEPLSETRLVMEYRPSLGRTVIRPDGDLDTVLFKATEAWADFTDENDTHVHDAFNRQNVILPIAEIDEDDDV